MADRELLESAAKAAGIVWDRDSEIWYGEPFVRHDWNPLTDDGDALRLAVKLRMTVDCEDAPAEADRNAAVRRAIVLAAANMTPNVADKRRA